MQTPTQRRWHKEPRWLDVSPCSGLSARGRWAWLTDAGSLTAKLQQRARGPLKVELLGQRLCRPLPSEAKLLGQPRARWALVREVLLAGCQPWVYARTVAPLRHRQQTLRQLKQLGDAPLGQLLFGNFDTIRSNLQIARFYPAMMPRKLTTKPCWGRRSLFWLQGTPLLVNEVFLLDINQP